MKSLWAALAVLALACGFAAPSFAQAVSGAVVVATCGTPPVTYTAGSAKGITQDTTGTLCTAGSGGGGGVVTNAGTFAVQVSNVAHVIADSGSTTAITGTVAVSNAGTFAVQDNGTAATDTDTNTAATATSAATSATALGVPTDTGYSGSGNATVVAGLKGLYTAFTGATPAGSAIIGKVGIDQTTVGTTNGVSLSQIGTTTVATGNGVVSAGVQRVAIASDNTAFATKFDQTTPGTTNAVALAQVGSTTTATGNGGVSAGVQRVAIASDNTAFSVNGTLQTQTDTVMIGGVNVREINAVTPLMGNGVTGTGSQRVTIASDNTPFAVKIDQTTPGTTNAVQIIAGTTGGATPYGLQATASTNSTSVKGSAGIMLGLSYFNTNTTIYYLRTYDSASAPTCSSATNFLRTWPIPPAAAAGGAGGAAIHLPVEGVTFANGIAFCVTGGPSSTDNTNAATGVFINIDYK